MLYAPLPRDGVGPIQDLDKLPFGRRVAQGLREEARRTGPSARIPRERPAMDRAATGPGSAFMSLRAEHDRQRVFMGSIDGFAEEGMAEGRHAASAEAAVPASARVASCQRPLTLTRDQTARPLVCLCFGAQPPHQPCAQTGRPEGPPVSVQPDGAQHYRLVVDILAQAAGVRGGEKVGHWSGGMMLSRAA